MLNDIIVVGSGAGARIAALVWNKKILTKTGEYFFMSRYIEN